MSLLPLDADGLRYDAEPSLDASGEVVFRAVLPGRYAAVLRTRDEEPVELARAEFALASGDTREVMLEVP